MPIAKGTYPIGTSKEIQNDLLAVLSKIQTETAIVHQDDQTVEYMTANQSDKGSYQEILEYCGKQITKAILGNTLSTDEGTRVGSLALGKVHQDVLKLYITKLKRQIEEYVDENIIRDLIDYNFTERLYPNFVLPLDEKDMATLSEVIYRLMSVGEIDTRETWTREYLGLPAKEEFEPEVSDLTPLEPGTPKPQLQDDKTATE